MELGGIERSLLGLLDSIDYDKYNVDLFLYGHHGPLFYLINKNVNILPEVKNLAYLRESFAEKVKHGAFYSAYRRVVNTWTHKDFDQLCEDVLKHCGRKLYKRYDIALGFFLPFDFLRDYVEADLKVGWIHTDYSSVEGKSIDLKKAYQGVDYIAAISEESKNTFIKQVPEYKDKMIVVENALSVEFVQSQANIVDVSKEMPQNSLKLLSVGRFCEPKNFDNVPEICSRILKKGINITWYLIGFGADERLIKDKIKEFHMEKHVIILGKKENPYPYIKACDLYVQPSRYEGKCVTVREAQMLKKPVVITKYATSASQLEDGVDGVIVPMDNESCAREIALLLQNKEKLIQLSVNCGLKDYSNSKEINKVFELI